MVSVFDIVFLALLVAFIVSRLYSVFGSHGDSENLRIVIKPLNKETEKDIIKMIEKAEGKKIIKEENLTEQDKTLEKIPAFDRDNFLKGARRVFELIIQAFSSGDMTSVKNLLSKKVCDAFVAALDYRKENNISSEVDFICFDKSEIKEVKLLKNSVKIVVEFVSEQVNILRNVKGEIIEGDENFVQKITDIWTFERSLNAKSNNWILVSTKKNA